MQHPRIPIAAIALLTMAPLHAQNSAPLQFTVTFPITASAEPLDGRLLLLLSKDGAKEPRELVTNDEPLRGYPVRTTW